MWLNQKNLGAPPFTSPRRGEVKRRRLNVIGKCSKSCHHHSSREFFMGSGVGIRQVGYFDCAGGGQVVVENNIAYVAQMRSPHGTSVIDVSDPKNPREL